MFHGRCDAVLNHTHTHTYNTLIQCHMDCLTMCHDQNQSTQSAIHISNHKMGKTQKNVTQLHVNYHSCAYTTTIFIISFNFSPSIPPTDCKHLLASISFRLSVGGPTCKAKTFPASSPASEPHLVGLPGSGPSEGLHGSTCLKRKHTYFFN